MTKRATSCADAVPFWASRVSQRKIRRLYENDAKGIYDEDLIDDVGYGLFARCESFIAANEAASGRAVCPRCSTVVPHAKGKDEILSCECGWELPWKEYFRTIQQKQLSGAEPVLEQFREFVKAFPTARTPREKVLLIDRLIHGFHWFHKTNSPTRPVAVNLIEGRLGDVVEFLEELTYSENSTAGTAENLEEWSRNIDVNRQWYPSRRHGRARSSEEKSPRG
jgi:hypothetical protein